MFLTSAFCRNALELSVLFVVVDTGRFSSIKCADMVMATLEK